MSLLLMAGSGESNFMLDLLGPILPDTMPYWAVVAVGAVAGFAVLMAFVAVTAMFLVWLERKVAGHIQVRLGPMRVGGWHGWAQSIADGLKLLTKEDLIPRDADRFLFRLAPMLVMASVLACFVALPFAPNVQLAGLGDGAGTAMAGSDIDLGIFFLLSISALATIAVVAAGWGSNNKWSLYGAMREAAQVASYEIPLGLSLMVPVMYFGTFSLRDATFAQADWFGMKWFLFSNPVLAVPSFVLFFTAALAETKRAPFDLPEAESELVAGFHTEYSGMRFAFFFLEEYAAMFVMSAVAVAFWFGGWNFPGLESLADHPVLYTLAAVTSFTFKGLLLVFVMMWLRWTLPRLRIDQVMTMGYKYLTPLSLALIFVAATWEYIKFSMGWGS